MSDDQKQLDKMKKEIQKVKEDVSLIKALILEIKGANQKAEDNEQLNDIEAMLDEA